MKLRRGPWLGAGTVLLLAGLSAAGAVALHWRPCRGTVLKGLLGDRWGPDYSVACLQAMDRGFSFLYPPGAPGRWAAESLCGVLAAVLAGTAWLLVVVPAAWSPTTKLVAAAPALATWATAIFSLAAAGSGSGPEVRTYAALLLAPNLLAVLAFVAVARSEGDDVALLRVALLLCGATAFGLVQTGADFAVSMSLSYASWDTPPGAGYPTVLGVVVLAALVIALSLRRASAAPSRPAGTRAG